MKKQSSKQPQKQSTVKIIGLIVLSIVVVLLGWNWYMHYTDKQKFMTLKHDILLLQDEFNKINPGWEYSEVCHSKGEKFKQNEVSNCYIQIEITKSVDFQKYKQSLDDKFRLLKEYDYKNEFNNNHSLSLEHKVYKNVVCGMSILLQENKSIISCHDSALDFYFPKTQ